MNTKKLNFKSITLTCVILLTLLLVIFSGCITITSPETPTVIPPTLTPTTATTQPTSTPISPTWTPPPTSSQSAYLPSIADVVALVKPSVVAINVEATVNGFFGPVAQQGAGSGWILDKNGFIVTNNHVVEGAETITVTLDDGRTFNADPKSVSTDALNDLAIIKINAQSLPALKRGSDANLRVGDWVIAIGNALGQGIRATEGIVSRKGVSLEVDQGQTLYDLIETSAAINPGNSGGPLVNLAGEVIGITSAKVASVGVEGMGYAISTDTAIPILQELINRGYVIRPFLGVQNLTTVDQAVATFFRLSVNKGVLIRGVQTNGPAEKAGMKGGDVITNIGGKDVASVDELTKVLYAAPIGQPLSVTFYRGTAKSTVQVIPIESPAPA
jgi:serine protease Do